MKNILITILMLLPHLSYADDSYYCPENTAYITVGMTVEQIIAACGPPMGKQEAGNRVSKQVPVTQLIYTSLNSGWDGWGGTTNLYNQWSIPEGPSGVSLQVDVMNNKITGITFNGATPNAMTLCSGGNFKIGDPPSAVYSACGNPTTINQTYVNQPVPTEQTPETWIYQNDKYQPPVTLTIINGKLESISRGN